MSLNVRNEYHFKVVPILPIVENVDLKSNVTILLQYFGFVFYCFVCLYLLSVVFFMRYTQPLIKLLLWIQ